MMHFTSFDFQKTTMDNTEAVFVVRTFAQKDD